mmetsp:Transcript_116239/g.276304  ORF Transcript_116239/g.276304 Transcript_116239/m.276304 type:complete len:218 (-) Transcript_116239:207-860(-)
MSASGASVLTPGGCSEISGPSGSVAGAPDVVTMFSPPSLFVFSLDSGTVVVAVAASASGAAGLPPECCCSSFGAFVPLQGSSSSDVSVLLSLSKGSSFTVSLLPKSICSGFSVVSRPSDRRCSASVVVSAAVVAASGCSRVSSGSPRVDAAGSLPFASFVTSVFPSNASAVFSASKATFRLSTTCSSATAASRSSSRAFFTASCSTLRALSTAASAS